MKKSYAEMKADAKAKALEGAIFYAVIGVALVAFLDTFLPDFQYRHLPLATLIITGALAGGLVGALTGAPWAKTPMPVTTFIILFWKNVTGEL